MTLNNLFIPNPNYLFVSENHDLIWIENLFIYPELRI